MPRRLVLATLCLVLGACTNGRVSVGERTTTSPPPGGTTTSTPAPITTRPPSATTTSADLQAAGEGAVSIQGSAFLLDGQPTYQGSAVEGLLLNARTALAVFDDECGDLSGIDPERNVGDFLAALPSYAAHGLGAVSINLQGGRPADLPRDERDHQPFCISAYEPDGSLKQAWLDRTDRVIRAADRQGMVVILGLFYFGQDHRLQDEAAVLRATDGVTDWLLSQGYPNVLVEVNNEANLRYDHDILQADRVHELIERVQERSGGRLAVSASFSGGTIPPDRVISQADYVLLHGNGQSPSDIRRMVQAVRDETDKPIVFNEDSTRLDNLEAAVEEGASWGYHDGPGFQRPPVDWAITSADKQAFFDRVEELTESSAPSPAPPPAPIQPPTEPVPAGYQLVMSTSTDRSGPVPLEGRVLSGSAYIFLTPEGGVETVQYLLDDRAVQREHQAPYDFAGGSASIARPLRTKKVKAGTHTITAMIMLADGSIEEVAASFSVER